MIREYIDAALQRAHSELIKDDEPFYGEVPELKGVWATGKMLEECRHNLAEVLCSYVISAWQTLPRGDLYEERERSGVEE
jgi:predicted RNase H-like HicB family nuclease